MRQGESNVLQCFIFVLQCPLYLLGNWDLIVLYQKRKVKCTLTRGVEGLPIVFLMGYQKQKIFLNTIQTSKSKIRKKKGSLVFCQTKDLLELSCMGAQNVLHTLTALPHHCGEIWEVRLLKTAPRFQGSPFFVFSVPLPSAPAVFPAPGRDF